MSTKPSRHPAAPGRRRPSLATAALALLVAGSLLGSSRAVAATCPAGGPSPVATTYTSFNGPVLQLYAWEGEEIAVLTPRADLCPATMARILSAFDDVYRFYRDTTGREPQPWYLTLYNGKSTVASVPATCGAGCGYLGFTGIELLDAYFERLYDGVHLHDEFDQVLFYEFGRNFWFQSYADRIDYPSDGPEAVSFATGYAVLMRFLAIEALGLRGGTDGPIAFDDVVRRARGLVDMYVDDPSLTWANSVQTFTQPALFAPFSRHDLQASFLRRLHDVHGRGFIARLWQEIDRRPQRATTQQAVDNLVLAASAAARANLTAVFAELWEWPVSQGARAEALATLGPPVAVDAYALAPRGPVALPGRQIKLKDTGAVQQLDVSLKGGRVTAPPRGSTADPTLHGASLYLENPRTGEWARLALPASGWTHTAGAGVGEGRDLYRDPHRATGPCSLVKVVAGGKIQAKCKGALGFTLDEAAQGALRAAVELGTPATEGYCTTFGGAVRVDRPLTATAPGLFRASSSPSPGVCPLHCRPAEEFAAGNVARVVLDELPGDVGSVPRGAFYRVSYDGAVQTWDATGPRGLGPGVSAWTSHVRYGHGPGSPGNLPFPQPPTYGGGAVDLVPGGGWLNVFGAGFEWDDSLRVYHEWWGATPIGWLEFESCRRR